SLAKMPRSRSIRCLVWVDLHPRSGWYTPKSSDAYGKVPLNLSRSIAIWPSYEIVPVRICYRLPSLWPEARCYPPHAHPDVNVLRSTRRAMLYSKLCRAQSHDAYSPTTTALGLGGARSTKPAITSAIAANP